MPMRLEDEIKRQLDESGPIDIDTQGGIRVGDNADSSESPVNPETGDPVTRVKDRRWFSWYHDNPKRLLAENAAMMIRFPGFTLTEPPKGLTWTGYLKPKGTNRYRIALIYPDNYPYSPPKVWVIDPKINSPKHQNPDGHLCLLHPCDDTWQTNTTAATIVAMASTWIWCYEYHQKRCGCSKTPCNHWPGKEA
jgi:hypothetical protein